MYLPRSSIAILYQHLQRTHNPLSPPVLILVSLEPDSLCGCRILTHLLKRDYIPHKIQPIAGYNDLDIAGQDVIRPMMTSQGGSGGVVICLGAGGLIDMAGLLRVTTQQLDSVDDYGGVEFWIIDSKRPWNLGNVLGGLILRPNETKEDTGVCNGRITRAYEPGRGGIVVFDDGDIEEDLAAEKESFFILQDMPLIPDDDGSDDEYSEESDLDESGKEVTAAPERGISRKRKSLSETDDEVSTDEEEDRRPKQRRRSNSSSSISASPSRLPRRGLISLSGPSNSTHSRSVSPAPAQAPKAPSAGTLRRRLVKLRKKHETVLINYYNLGAWYAEPVSSMMYSLASELGREDNNLLWHAIVGVSSLEIYGRSSTGVSITGNRTSPIHSPESGWLGVRGSRIRQLLRDEVRRLNPPELSPSSSNGNRNGNSENHGLIPTTARHSTDTSIRLSPEPKFLLIRHWSLYESMLHSPYLSARLHIWSDAGRKRLHKLLAKMGVSLAQCKQNYVYMDMEVKQGLRKKLLKYSDLYGLDGLVPPADNNGRDRWDAKEDWGFVRSWGWKATLSAQDVGIVVGALLEAGKNGVKSLENGGWDRGRELKETTDEDGILEGEEWVGRFWDAYDALENIDELKAAIPTAQHLHRAILRTGTSLIEKRQIRHLRAFRVCVVKDGPDVTLFNHSSALTKLALWIGEAIAEQERESKGKVGHRGRGTPLVVAGLNETRGIYVVVGTGGGGLNYEDPDVVTDRKKRRQDKKRRREARESNRANKKKVREERRAARRQAREDDEGDDDEEDESESESSDSSPEESEDEPEVRDWGFGRNRFGNAFQEVVEETNARVRIDSFEHCVVEVKKEDLTGFLESLGTKAVVAG